MKVTWVLLLCLVLHLGLIGCGEAPHPKTLWLNSEGSVFLKVQNYSSALDKFIEALKYNPYQAEIHLNMGLAFEGLEQPEKALQSYHQAQSLAQNPLMKFMALFNEAQLLGKAKKVDEALALYQKALEIVPSSKEVKTNIELLTQDQQGKGGGEEQENKDKDDQNKDPNIKNEDKGKGDPKDQKDQKDPKDKDKDKKEDQKYQKSAKYQPRKFDGKDLSESDVKKILGELRQQEQKIRAEFNRKEMKEQPRDKDW